MSNAKNVSTLTPGPWEYLQADGVVVTQESDWGAREIGWSDADYRLIAAAPDLLAVCQAIERAGVGRAQIAPDLRRALNAALVKAGDAFLYDAQEGETQAQQEMGLMNCAARRLGH